MGYKKFLSAFILLAFTSLFLIQGLPKNIVEAGQLCFKCEGSCEEPTPTPTPTEVPRGGGGGGGSAGAPTCDNPKPSPAPDLFQINTSLTEITLYFTPNNGNATYYMVSFGLSFFDDQFSGIFPVIGSNKGVQNLTISHLAPNTTYFFRVRAGDGCATGDWSNTFEVNTNSQIYYRYH